MISIEVKSGRRTKSLSLDNYVKAYKPDYSIQISQKYLVLKLLNYKIKDFLQTLCYNAIINE